MRDMTKAQFSAALKRYGMGRVGFFGYVEVGYGTSVSTHNAGTNRRAQLAYLIKKQEEAAERAQIMAEITPKSDPATTEQKERSAQKMRETSAALNKFFFGARA